MVQSLPFGDTEVPVPGFGAMGLSFGMGTNLSLEQAEPVLQKAIDLGCTFWDTAVSHIRNRSQRGSISDYNIWSRLFTELVPMRSCLGNSSRNTMSAINSSVRTPGPRHKFNKWQLTNCCYQVASKCGFDILSPSRKVTNSAAHIKEYIEGTIDRLGFTPDLYYLHRIDPSELNKPGKNGP